jgi:hypothetical protein
VAMGSLHFHSDVTVMLRNNGFVAVSITMVTAYGSVAMVTAV